MHDPKFSWPARGASIVARNHSFDEDMRWLKQNLVKGM